MIEETKRRPDEVLIIAIYHFIEAALLLLGLLGIGVAGIAVLFAMAEDPSVAIALGFMTIGAVFLVLGAALNVAVGWGLLRMQNWARWAAIILSVLRLPNFPIGTVIGGLIIYYLVQDRARALFEAR